MWRSLFLTTCFLTSSLVAAWAQEPVTLGGGIASSDIPLVELQQKINSLEEALQTQTGQIEELQNTVRTLEKRMSQSPAPAAETAEIADETTEASPAAETTEGGPVALGSALPSTPLETPSAALPSQSTTTTAAAPTTPQGTYDAGLEAMKRGQYDEARGHFTTFLKENPNDKLAPNAYYWLGEGYYAQKNYRKAGENFLKGFQDYPESSKAPDNLLKLGLSLQSAKQDKQACQSFSELLRRYPDASPSVINRAKRARAACS